MEIVMRKFLFFLLIVLPIPLSAQTAKIKIDVERTIGAIDPKIYGVFMEPIHFNGRRMGLPDTADFNTVYGNLYDPSSPLAMARREFCDGVQLAGRYRTEESTTCSYQSCMGRRRQ
jgi:hypothetical protein